MFCALALASLLTASTAASTTTPPTAATATAPTVVREHSVVGSLVVDVAATSRDATATHAAITAAFDEVARTAAVFSPTGPLQAVAAGNGAAVSVEPEVFAVLVEAQRVAKLSKGAYDPTTAGWYAAWKFDAAVDERVLPGADVLAARKPLVGVELLTLDVTRRTAKLKAAGAVLDLADVAVGYALDRARGVLLEAGVDGFLLSINGNVVGHGTKNGAPWLVGVQDPRGTGPFLSMPLKERELGAAIITVSDNDGVFFIDDVRQHRLLDPRTGLPARKARSVTIVSNDALTAACLARAVFVLGPKDGLPLVERLKANAIVVGTDNSVSLSKGLTKLLANHTIQQRTPTDAP
jgi:thiamine biosynthesis lipoprotein